MPKANAIPKELLTEAKLSAFAVYQKEIMTMAADAMGMGMSAMAKAGTDQKKLEKAVTSDERFAKVEAVTKAALAKSGLTQTEVAQLTHLTSQYYTPMYAKQETLRRLEQHRKAIAEAKEKGKEPNQVDVAMAKAFGEQEIEIERIRKDISDKYGPESLALMKKHEPEFFAINEQLMKAALGGMKMKAPK